MAKYFKLDVTRSEGTYIYVKVPDDFDGKKLIRYANASIIREAAEETTDRTEWEQTHDYEVQAVGECSDEEVNEFTVYELTPEQVIEASGNTPSR